MDNSASLRNKPQFSIPEGVLRAVDAVRSVASPVINQAKEFGQGYMATTDEAFKRMDEQTRAGKDPLNSTFQLGNAITNAPGIGAGDDILKFLPAVIGSVRAVSKTGKIAHEASKADDLVNAVKNAKKISTSDQTLLDLLSPRQKQAFAKGTPEEQKIALEHLRLKNNIETNLAKFQQEVDQGKNIMGHSDIIDDVVNRFDNNYSSLKPNNTIDMELEDDARRLYKDLLGKEKNDAPLSTIVGELNEALDFYRNKQK